MPDETRDLIKEIPHLIVLVVLVLVLLVVVTKYNWIHCTQVPGNWCSVYCDVIMRSHSKVALLYGEDGIGDPVTLENMIRRTRPGMYLEPVKLSDASYGMLKGYDLVILERARSVSYKESRALREYLNKGGMMIWVGDSASRHYYDQIDIADVIARTPDDQLGPIERILLPNAPTSFNESGINKTTIQSLLDHEMSVDQLANFSQELAEKGYFGEEAKKNPRGFGPLQDVLFAKFIDVVNVTPGARVTLKIVNRQNMAARGLFYEFEMRPTKFADVKENAAWVDKIAQVSVEDDAKDGAGNKTTRAYTGIYETRYAGRVVYSAIPLEDLNSTTLLTNILDYLVPC